MLREGWPWSILTTTGIKLRSFRDFLTWLIIGVSLYLIDCLITTDMSDVPWIARGLHIGLFSFLVVAWMLAPVIQLIKERIDGQPRRQR
jgi:hypothetical protein